nr:response regulator [Opitutaceae bacterium]
LPVLGLAEHPDGRAWALARLPALGDGAGQSGRVLHGLWRVDTASGRIEGLARAPLAVVDRTGVHATDFFEPVGPAGEGAIWWLGGSQGVARVALDHLPAEGHDVPAPYLLAARDANGEKLPLDGGWRLAGLRGLELDLSVAEVAQAMPLAVQTRLVGEDGAASEWSPLSRERLHRWERLAGGRFFIEARAVGASGLAGPALSLGFTVAPRFFETVWFWSAVTAALLSVAGILASYWTRRSRRRQLELERVVGERTSSLLATNEELTRQSAKRTELVSVVSHEIRSPLVGAGLLAERIAARAGEAGLAEEARQLSEQLHGLRKVLDGTLDLSRFELGLVPVRWRREHAEQFVQSTLAVHEASARKKGLGWRKDFSGLDRALLIDSVNLTRVLHNLVGNAVKYTDTGEVVVTAAYERQARALRFSVRDTGPGLPDEVASTLQSTRLRRHALGEQDAHRPSSGLGLALASRLIALGGDSLECRDARPGLELRFGVPALEAPTTRCTDGEEDFAPPYAGSVLILEDEPAQRDHACDVLEPLGLSVDLVATCAEAVKLAQARRYDLALLDFNLPDGTGLEVLLQLRAGRCAPEVIALVTAHESAPIEQACREAGATEFLAKPLTLRAAIRLLDRTARRRQAEGGQPVEMPSKAVR